jgi:hypothetical protein
MLWLLGDRERRRYGPSPHPASAGEGGASMSPSTRARWAVVGVVVLVGAILSSGTVAEARTDRGPSPQRSENARERAVVLLSPEANRLNAYDVQSPFVKQTVIEARSADPEGLDINGQVCFLNDGSRRFIAGEDTGQPNPPPGWGCSVWRARGWGSCRRRRSPR